MKNNIKPALLTTIVIFIFNINQLFPLPATAAEVKFKGIEGKVNVKLPGEPYHLEGKRMVFTNWFYIRPGILRWYDKEGKALRLIDYDTATGPWGPKMNKEYTPVGIKLVAQPAQRFGPLIKAEHPWEQTGVSFCTIIKDGDIFKAWGPCEDTKSKRFMAYFESKDGLKWKRPKLGIVEYNGSKENNLINLDPDYYGCTFWGWSVFKDPVAAPAERYKAMKAGKIPAEKFAEYRKKWPDDWVPLSSRGNNWFVINAAISADGKNWTILPQPISVEHSDTQSVAYYDRQLKKYVLYTRTYMFGNRSANAPSELQVGRWGRARRRSIGRTESIDFRHFEPSQLVLMPEPKLLPSDHIYNNARTSIPGAPDHHLMFPTLYHMTDDTTTITLATSFNGKNWYHITDPLILKTNAFGQWDGGCIFSHPNLLELPDGSFALPYTGDNYPHKYPRGDWRFWPGYALWPKGRLIGIEAAEHGTFATVAVVPPGKKLRINALTKRAGKILIEVVKYDPQYNEHKALPNRTFNDCDPIIGEKHWTPVTWKGIDDLGCKEGQAVFLRFKMFKAKIFGLQFE